MPAQTLTTLSFCEPGARHLRAWVNGLPLANIGETARQLYHAVIEFNQLNISAAARLELMDLIRGPIYYVCRSLNGKYLNQGVTLDEQQRKVANLAQALQTHLAIGYKIIVEHLRVEGALKHKGLMARALHRALSDLVPSLLRSYQLYIPTPAGLWHEVHRFHQTARGFNLHRVPVEEPVDESRLSIQDVYLKAILLGACQPNQLLQRELADVYDALNGWTPVLDIQKAADEKSVLVIHPDGDGPPQYSYLIKPGSDAACLGLNTLPLVRLLHNRLTSAQAGGDKPGKRPAINIPENLGQPLLEHLVQSWGGMKQRTFSRTPVSGRVTLAVGLTATHFHMSGRVGFYSLLYGQSANSETPILGALPSRFTALDTRAAQSQKDVWEQSFDAGQRRMIETEDEPIDFVPDTIEDQPLYTGQLVNVSPRGYCIQWPDKVAGNLKTGEVAAINEEKLRHWNLGVVRWLRLSKENGAQMGVELIAPNSVPCGIRQLNKTGAHGDYLRGLFIPEIRAIGQDASVLTPRLPFQVGNKVTINIEGVETKYQLIKRLLSTGILSQFQIRPIAQQPLNPGRDEDNGPEDGFESLWRQL